VEVFTIGFTRKTASDFFTALRQAGIRRLVDVRLNNTSQLAGFTRRDDLPFFLHEICQAEYVHEPSLAPTPDLLAAYRKGHHTWEDYERRFLELMRARRVDLALDRTLFAASTVLLCSEPTADRCHRRLVLDYLGQAWGDLTPVHL
jgi:uncharacterized protein (DUF488 family)